MSPSLVIRMSFHQGDQLFINRIVIFVRGAGAAPPTLPPVLHLPWRDDVTGYIIKFPCHARALLLTPTRLAPSQLVTVVLSSNIFNSTIFIQITHASYITVALCLNKIFTQTSQWASWGISTPTLNVHEGRQNDIFVTACSSSDKAKGCSDVGEEEKDGREERRRNRVTREEVGMGRRQRRWRWLGKGSMAPPLTSGDPTRGFC